MCSKEKNHEFYMNEALIEAQKAADQKEVPVGAIITTKDGNIIARAHNLRESKQSAVAHAELLAIEQACSELSQWRLTECTLYVTLEPCFMCAGAIILARISTVVYGAKDAKTGAVQSLANVLTDQRLNHICHVISGVCEDQASHMLKNFFKNKRSQVGRLKDVDREA